MIRAYLSIRKQHVSLNGFDSGINDVTRGVARGSSLGPLLFLIFINDFRLRLAYTSSSHFADDTFIIYNIKLIAKSVPEIISSICLQYKSVSLNSKGMSN